MLMLGSGLGACYSLAMLAHAALRQWRPELPVLERQFTIFLINSFFVQGGALMVAHLFLRQHGVSWSEFLGLDGPAVRSAVLYGMVTAALVLPGVYLLKEAVAYLLTLLQGATEEQGVVRVLQVSQSLPQKICFGVVAILVAPIGEETLFRGILYRFLKQLGWPRVALVSSSLFFGLIHGNIVALVPLSCLAAVLALLYDKTENLLAPIVAHAVFNAVNFGFIVTNSA